jgi:hypothetical protein
MITGKRTMKSSARAPRLSAEHAVSYVPEVEFSAHARARLQRRGIHAGTALAAIALGEPFADHNHSTTYWLTRRCLAGASAAIRRTMARFVGLAVVVSCEGVVVTVQHAPYRKRNWRGGR